MGKRPYHRTRCASLYILAIPWHKTAGLAVTTVKARMIAWGREIQTRIDDNDRTHFMVPFYPVTC